MPSASSWSFRRPDLSKVEEKTGEDISAVFSTLSQGDEDLKYPPRFANVKKSLIKDPVAVKESWLRLKKALRRRISKVESQGSASIPSIEFERLGSLSESERSSLLDRGCVVIRGVIPEVEARDLKSHCEEYIRANPHTVGFPKNDPAVYELYFSKSQISARSNPRMRSTLRFMNNLWHASEDTEISLDQNISYADRFRIRKPGDAQFSLGPHADGGGIERWEDAEYARVYSSILSGHWEDFDPYDATHRVGANMTLYPTGNACSAFRTFQGWLAISDIGPGEGTILLAPLIKEVTAYYILRPFFDANDEFDFSADFKGTNIGKAQEFNELTHPDLELKKLMTPVPKVKPGDAVFWHCDMIHAVDPVHEGCGDSAVVYIPSVPLCSINTELLLLQREALIHGLTAPDFPGFPNSKGETEHVGRGTVEDVESFGAEAMKESGLLPFEIAGTIAGEKAAIEKANDFLFIY